MTSNWRNLKVTFGRRFQSTQLHLGCRTDTQIMSIMGQSMTISGRLFEVQPILNVILAFNLWTFLNIFGYGFGVERQNSHGHTHGLYWQHPWVGSAKPVKLTGSKQAAIAGALHLHLPDSKFNSSSLSSHISSFNEWWGVEILPPQSTALIVAW